jgi:glycosyltransferase involved in cell wall biosynthesis
MRIGFLLGWPEISGGTYVILEHAKGLNRLGHYVYILTREAVEPGRYSWHPNAGELEWLTIHSAQKKTFDVVLATWWESPFLLHQLDAAHYLYFVQSIESRFWPPEDPRNHDTRLNNLGRDLCESTYTFCIPCITEARWIKHYLHENYNKTAFLVRNGIRKDIYRSGGFTHEDRVPGKLRVLVEGPVDVPYKNVSKTIELCCKAGVDEVWLLTSSDIDSFSGVDRVFSCIPVTETPPIYRSCDVLVKLSYIEGMFGPPLEMFHCGGTAIVYDVTGHDEYIIHGENGYVVRRDNEKQVVDLLARLRDDQEELTRLKAGALATASAWHDWEDSTREFEAVLHDIVKGKRTSRAYLQRHTGLLYEQHALKISAREWEAFQHRESHENGDPTGIDNFIQLYWHYGDGWSAERFMWKHYASGKKAVVTFDLNVDKVPINLRIDPSVRIGIIEMISIEIYQESIGRKVFSTVLDGFGLLATHGTIANLTRKGKNIYLSYGSDPQFILPVLNTVRPGENIQITIELKEMGFKQFISQTAGGHSAAEYSYLENMKRIFSRRR